MLEGDPLYREAYVNQNMDAVNGIKVLVVDDDEWICYYLSRFLNRNGYHPITALSGLEAVELAEKMHPQLILMDIIMPDMDGLETIQKLRERGENGIVIVVTGHVDLSSAREAMKLGAYEYIAKPFSLNTLKKVLQNGLTEWSKDPSSNQSKVDLSRYEESDSNQTIVLANSINIPKDRQRLLVVDDSELTIGLMTKELTSRGYEIISSKNVEKATQMILRPDTRPEMVLVDVNMPNINGAQFCRFIKSNSLFEGVKVVLCSTMPTDELQALATSYGADGYIAKDDLFSSWQLPQLR